MIHLAKRAEFLFTVEVGCYVGRNSSSRPWRDRDGEGFREILSGN